MPVDSKHPQHDGESLKWELVRDVINSDVQKHIKDVDSSDPIRSRRYRDDAQFTNFTGRTKNSLVGAIFRREPFIDLPESVEYLNKDATGACESLGKFAQEITGEILQTGRYGILTDFPAIDPTGLSQQEIEQSDIKARMYKYPAEAIINWKQERVNGKLLLTMVVLKEVTDEIDPRDGFQWRQQIQFRVLRLMNGVYIQAIFDVDSNIIGAIEPKDANGDAWNIIPFEFIGAEDNDAEVDPAPLFDLARLNIGHLRNSADYEESVHITGQPTLFIDTVLDPNQFADANPDGVKIGSRKGHNLGPGGKADFKQAAPNQLADEAMKRKEQQAVMIGAKLITPTATNETAEAARMRHSGETSILSVMAKNIEKGLTKSVWHVLRFMDSRVDTLERDAIRIDLNDQFFDSSIDPNMIMAQIQLAQKGIIDIKDIRNTLRKFGQLEDNRTDSEIDRDVAISLGSSSTNGGNSGHLDAEEPKDEEDKPSN